jgi:quercetin dioxygenase-like cupin family protein
MSKKSLIPAIAWFKSKTKFTILNTSEGDYNVNNTFMEDIPLEATPLGGNARLLISNPQLRLVNLILSPGERVLSHTAPVEVVFLVMEGQGSVIVGNEKHEINQGQMFTCPADLEREIIADAGTALKLLVIRAPNL